MKASKQIIVDKAIKILEKADAENEELQYVLLSENNGHLRLYYHKRWMLDIWPSSGTVQLRFYDENNSSYTAYEIKNKIKDGTLLKRLQMFINVEDHTVFETKCTTG